MGDDGDCDRSRTDIVKLPTKLDAAQLVPKGVHTSKCCTPNHHQTIVLSRETEVFEVPPWTTPNGYGSIPKVNKHIHCDVHSQMFTRYSRFSREEISCFDKHPNK